MNETPLWQIGACELATAIGDRRISAQEAVAAAADRMRQKNGAINAVVDDLGDEALAEAEALDEVLRSSGPGCRRSWPPGRSAGSRP